MSVFARQTKYYLLTVALILVVLHLHLSQFGSDFLSHSFLFWLTTIILIWQKRERLSWQSDRLSTVIGCIILGLVLYRSLYLFPKDYFLQISPILSLLGWALLASGKNLKPYRKGFILLGFLAIPWELIYTFNVAQLTAKFSIFILTIFNFEVVRQGAWLVLPAGSVEVYNGCSGVQIIFQLLGFSWILLLIIPTNWQQKIYLPSIAIVIGFVINAIRVALMAVLVGLSDYRGFEYWHVGTGSLIFSAIAVLLLAICAIKIAFINSNSFKLGG